MLHMHKTVGGYGRAEVEFYCVGVNGFGHSKVPETTTNESRGGLGSRIGIFKVVSAMSYIVLYLVAVRIVALGSVRYLEF